VNNAMEKLYNMHNQLLNENDLKITSSEAVKIFIGNYFEIQISLAFELNNLEKIDEIVDQFDEFTAYLDSISQL
jgi:hypothetical protein